MCANSVVFPLLRCALPTKSWRNPGIHLLCLGRVPAKSVGPRSWQAPAATRLWGKLVPRIRAARTRRTAGQRGTATPPWRGTPVCSETDGPGQPHACLLWGDSEEPPPKSDPGLQRRPGGPQNRNSVSSEKTWGTAEPDSRLLWDPRDRRARPSSALGISKRPQNRTSARPKKTQGTPEPDPSLFWGTPHLQWAPRSSPPSATDGDPRAASWWEPVPGRRSPSRGGTSEARIVVPTEARGWQATSGPRPRKTSEGSF